MIDVTDNPIVAVDPAVGIECGRIDVDLAMYG